MEKVPLLTRVDAVTFSEQNFAGVGSNCTTDFPVMASVMMSNHTTTHISFSPRYRVKAFSADGKVIWSQDANFGTELWPGAAVVNTGIRLCEDLYECVDSIKVMNRGPVEWQPLDNGVGNRPTFEATDIRLILYSITGAWRRMSEPPSLTRVRPSWPGPQRRSSSMTPMGASPRSKVGPWRTSSRGRGCPGGAD